MQSIRELWSSARTQFSRPLRFLVIVLISILAIYVLYFVLEKIFIYLFARNYVEAIADAWDLDKNIANALVWAVFVATVLFVGLIFSVSKTKRLVGVAGVILLLIGQSLVVWRGSFDKPFDRSGIATKCYVITRDAVRYGQRPGIDPATGRECRPVTPEIAERLNEYSAGKRPERIIGQPTFFSLRTGNPIVWYYKNKDGEIELFSLMGFHPDSGEELLPVNKQIVELWKAQIEKRKQQEARRVPKRIDLETYPPFDPITGEARVWYRKDENGDFAFYDWFGFDPQTGEKLSIITHNVLAEWQKHRKEAALPRCYIITRDGVRYGEKPGLDVATGRQCREVTPQILERLRAYENGNRPKKIETANPVFFDPRTGEAIVWYFKDKRGDIELFDLMGFHPQTGEELLPGTKEVYEQWKKQNGKGPPQNLGRIPKRILDLTKHDFFDRVTGEIRTWYWRSESGEYEFYDNPGYHPQTGDELKALTREDFLKYSEDLKSLEEKRKKEIEQKERDRAAQAEEFKREAERQEELRRKQQAEREREAQSAQLCDQLAANPSDPRRGRDSDGVSHEVLKFQADEAINACEMAAQQYPNELRFQYQLARALSIRDRPRAQQIQRKLVRLGYPAAYDNLGWLIISEQKNFSKAVELFRAGTRLGDPDAMISLAEMIDKGRTVPMNPSENKIALYARAAQLGDLDAERALQVEQEKEIQQQQQRAIEFEQQRQAMEMFRHIIGRIPIR